MKGSDYLKLVIWKINFLVLKIFHYKTSIKGHCCTWNTTIKDKGRNNTIRTGKHIILKDCHFLFEGNNHQVILGNNINLEGITFELAKDGSVISIGDGTWLGRGCFLTAQEDTSLCIGEKTIVAKNCAIKTSDSHYIYDSLGREINKPASIKIGNHVWIGESSFVLKGSIIENGCIIGARSLVTGSVSHEPNSIYVGTPAKLYKKNISWKL